MAPVSVRCAGEVKGDAVAPWPSPTLRISDASNRAPPARSAAVPPDEAKDPALCVRMAQQPDRRDPERNEASGHRRYWPHRDQDGLLQRPPTSVMICGEDPRLSRIDRQCRPL